MPSIRFLCVVGVLALVSMNGSAALAQGDVRITDVISGNRTVAMTWSSAAGDTLTPEARQSVPEINFRVPAALGISGAGIRNGDLVVGRGAGRADRRDWLIYVGNSGDLYEKAEAPPPPPPETFMVTGAFQFGRNYVAVAYSEPVNEPQATNPGSYAFTPGLTVEEAVLQDNRRTVILRVANLAPNTSYSVTVSGVTGESGDPLPSGGPFAFQTRSGPVVNLAEIQNDVDAFRNSTVTVIGQVYIPTGSRGTFASGYIQDGSSRGINLYSGPVMGNVNRRDNVVEVVGVVVDSIGTAAITAYSTTLLATEQPHLGARVLTLRETLTDLWEGTYIQTEGYLSRKDTQTDPSMATYTATTLDTLFTGYRLWRSSQETPDSFELLRTYSLLDSTWTLAGGERIFVDPDSIIVRGTERDPDPIFLAGPFNGFGYHYSVTWFEAAVDNTIFPPQVTVLERSDPADGIYPEVVFPSKLARVSVPLLANVKVVPNPYNPAAAFQRGAFPGPPRIQFINLPSRAVVEIYTLAGDKVRVLEKVEDPTTDFVDWDLKNDNGEDVAPGIYLYYATAAGETRSGKFVIAR